MAKQLSIFDSKPVDYNFSINLNKHFRSFKSMKESYQTQYNWITNSLFINSGLSIIKARYKLNDDQIQSLLDSGKIKVVQINETYITWVIKYLDKKRLTKHKK